MERDFKRLLAIVLIAMLVGAGAMYGGMEWWNLTEETEENSDGLMSGNGDKELPDKLHKVEVAYELISDKFFRDVDSGELVAGAIEGMLKTLDDPYSVYMDAKTASQFNDSLDSSFEGIGAEVTMVDGDLVIVAPFKNSPAEKAGLKPNDKIVSVNGESVEGLDLYEATLKIRGKKGTEVKLQVMREGLSTPIEISVKRDEIPVETVISEVKKEKGIELGYIQITSFSEHTAEDFKEQLTDLEKQGIKGLIIDVRGNPGGLLSSVDKILNELVTSDKPYVQIEERSGEVIRSYSKLEKKKEYPITVLIDEGSASASEILAGALQEAEGYPLIGTKSFGKGTVQQAVPMGDGSNIKLTMFKWLTPNGNWIHGKGIKPDIPVRQPNYFYSHPLQIEKTLEKEMNNNQIKNAQEMLQGLGFEPGRTDGYYSTETVKAVEAFQAKNKLPTTGEIDEKTAEALQESVLQAVRDEDNDLQLQAALEYLTRVN